jgi:hypothetical protein
MQGALQLTLKSSLLLFPSFKGYKDYYKSKIFAYIGSQRNILTAPGNKDLVDNLINKTQAGKIANSANEFAELLENWHQEWKVTGTIKYSGIKEEIMFY